MAFDISPWQAPPPSLLIGTGDLHLWRFRTDISARSADSLRQSLSADECIRADRFINPLHQIQFIAARYGLRHILAGYLKCLPAAILFDYGEQGKPSLQLDNAQPLDFNLSHSGGWGLVAVTSGLAVGVDLEQIVPKDSLLQLSDYAFDMEEKGLFSAFSPARQERGFFRLWTAKEARLKMLGVGFGNMNKVVLPCFQRFFVPAKGYVAAVAIDHPVKRIIRYHDVMSR